MRAIRVSDKLWSEAQWKAIGNDTNVTAIIIKALEAYVARK